MHIKTSSLLILTTISHILQCAQEKSLPTFESNITVPLNGKTIEIHEFPRHETSALSTFNPAVNTLASCFVAASTALPVVRTVLPRPFYNRYQYPINAAIISLNAFSVSQITHHAWQQLENNCDTVIEHFGTVATAYNAAVNKIEPYEGMIIEGEKDGEDTNRILWMRRGENQEIVWQYDQSLVECQNRATSALNWALVGSENFTRMQEIITKAKALDTQLYPINNIKGSSS